MTKRAVLYARVSGDDTKQEVRNLEGQITMGEEYARKKGYTIIDIFKEDHKGARGADINLPKLNAVRDMAANHEFDVLVVREIDRLSRSLAKQLIVEQEMKRHGVEIDYVLGDYPDTPEGNFMRHMRATVAEYEREKINERVIRGRYNKVKAGSVFSCGRAPYGYRELKNDNGKYRFEIDVEEAKVVRQIFEWYISGLASRKIAARLTEMQIPTYVDNNKSRVATLKKKHKRGVWQYNTILSMIKNETYAGVWHYGKYIGRTGSKKRSKKEQVAVSVPAIVRREVWEKANDVRNKNRRVRIHQTSYEFLLKGIVFCGHCQYRASAVTNRRGEKVYGYYHCSAHRNEMVRDCPHRRVFYNAEKVESLVWAWVVSLLTNPKQLKEGLQSYYGEKERDLTPFRERQELISEMLDLEEEKLSRLLDLYLSGDFDHEVLAERKEGLEIRINALQHEKLEIESMLQELSVGNDQIEAVVQFGKEISRELELADADIEIKRYILNVLDTQVRVRMQDEQRCVFIQCALGLQCSPLLPNSKCAFCPYSRSSILLRLDLRPMNAPSGLHS